MSYDEHLISQAGGDGEPAEDESICGETFDHEERVTYEDDDVLQFECTRCGAEFWEDKDGAE